MRQDYIQRTYNPKNTDLVAEYFIEAAKGFTLPEVANAVAGESSIDTWTDIKTLNPALAKRLKPHVFYIQGNIVKIAYNHELFEPGSVAQILSSIAGNILSMKMVKNIKLLDFHLPKLFVSSFLGPLFGIEGIRKVLKVPKRPLIGTIVKPKTGLTPKEHATVAYNSWLGGLDLVKDDENLTNQGFNPFKERVKQTLRARDIVEKATKERKAYMANITAGTTEEMIKRAEYVKSLGGRYVMVDIITSGWTALQSLRIANKKLKLILHGHRCMHSAITRNEKHGISMLAIAKLTRLVGFDQLHTGTIIGKMEGKRREILDIDYEMEHQNVEENNINRVLRQKWYDLKSLMPVASGGIQPCMIPELYANFGNDIIMQFGGGVHAHPDGTLAGASAAREALTATLKKIPLKEHAKNHPELMAALKKWG